MHSHKHLSSWTVLFRFRDDQHWIVLYQRGWSLQVQRIWSDLFAMNTINCANELELLDANHNSTLIRFVDRRETIVSDLNFYPRKLRLQNHRPRRLLQLNSLIQMPRISYCGSKLWKPPDRYGEYVTSNWRVSSFSSLNTVFVVRFTQVLIVTLAPHQDGAKLSRITSPAT